MKRCNRCIIVICNLIILLSNVVYVAADENILDRAKVIGEYRQDEVESMIWNFVTELYNATSDADAENAANELKSIMTEDEIETLKSEIGYNTNRYEVQEIVIHYISKENSYDGRAREMIDLKVGNDEVNYMYVIECKINDEDKIFSHTIWRY